MTQTKAKNLRDTFLAWQCRIRQIAMREHGGRPSPGMRPRLLDRRGRELAAALTVLLLPRDFSESTAFFRFQVMRSADPRDVYERALGYLQADFFQQPEQFSDLLLAVLPQEGHVYLVTTDTDELLDIARASLTRGFTTSECRTFSFGDQCPTLEELRAGD